MDFTSDLDKSHKDGLSSIQGPSTKNNFPRRRHSQMESSFNASEQGAGSFPTFHQNLPHILDSDRGHKSSTEVFPSP